MNEATIISIGQALGCELQQKKVYVASDLVHIAKPIEVVSAAKIARGFIADTTMCLGFI